jgi:hypothetical protein
MDAMTVDAKAHDERTAELYVELDKVERRRASLIEQAHRIAGDKKLDKWTRRERWAMSIREAVDFVTNRAIAHPADEAIYGSDHPVNWYRRWIEASEADARLTEEIADLDAIYDASPWQRFFPCDNSNGHIHASLGCHTLNKGQYRTQMSWRPGLSGHTVADAIAELGTWLCSVCFPDAPAEHCQTRSEATKAEREAKAAAAAEAKFDKKLRDGEQFRDGNVWGQRSRGDWVTTVAGCLTVLRDEVEGRDQWGRGPASNHEHQVRAAEMAKRVLLDREARKPGTGKTQEQISKIIAAAIKRNRADGARLDEEGNVTA